MDSELVKRLGYELHFQQLIGMVNHGCEWGEARKALDRCWQITKEPEGNKNEPTP